MKKIICCLALLLCGAASADDLADANALYAKKSVPQAIALLTKLANGGNADAQFRLSEIYLDSASGVADPAKADAWLRKAAAKGDKAALAAIERGTQREARRADIEYWMSGYDGQDLKSGKYRCPAPRFPVVSKQNEEIDAVNARMTAWESCFNAAAVALNAASPLTQRIPKDVAELMTKEEMEKAKAYLADVHTGLAAEAKVASKLVLADFTVWRDATNAYVSEHNRIVNENKGMPKSE